MSKTIRTPKTKILATLGPSSSSPAVLRKLYEAGLDAVRLNFSHGTPAEHEARVTLVRELNRRMRRHITILQDLKGNRIRIGGLKKPLELKKRQRVTLVQADTASGPGEIPFDYRGSLKVIKKGHVVYIDDGILALEVKTAGKDSLSCEVTAGGTLKEHKGVNIPLAHLEFPPLSGEDRTDIEFGVAHKVDFIAQSFVRSAEDVLAVARLVKPRLPSCRIISKIEAREAAGNLEEIISVSDGVMVARGDLGVMFPLWEVPILQKRIIKICNLLGKPVITATQMMETMTTNPGPTRAEVSDVANAVLDGTDAVMLSAETAVGDYPVETIEAMARICRKAEQEVEESVFDRRIVQQKYTRIDQSIAMSALFAASHFKVKAIIALTQSGSTPLWMSRMNAGVPIFALTPLPETLSKVTLFSGVHPIAFHSKARGQAEEWHQIEETLLGLGLVKDGDMVVMTIGEAMGKSGHTNTMKIMRVGDHRKA
jgi:pyruvate kinase